MLILVTTDKSFHRIQFHTLTPMETAAGWLQKPSSGNKAVYRMVPVPARSTLIDNVDFFCAADYRKQREIIASEL